MACAANHGSAKNNLEVRIAFPGWLSYHFRRRARRMRTERGSESFTLSRCQLLSKTSREMRAQAESSGRAGGEKGGGRRMGGLGWLREV